MKSAIFCGASALVCLSSAWAVNPDGTNVWIGASSGGLMSEAANWECHANDSSITDPMVLMQKRVVLDFRGLVSGAVITNDITLGNTYKKDSSGPYTMLSGLIFNGGADDSWTITRTTGKGLWACDPCYFDIAGGTLNWDDNNSGSGDWYPHKLIYKRGTGKVRFVSTPYMTETQYRADAGVSAFVGSTQLGNCRIVGTGSGKVQVESKTMLVGSVSSSSGNPNVQVQIDDGAVLHLNGGWNAVTDQAGATLYGDLLGTGTLRITGGINYLMAKGSKTAAHSFAGTLEPWLGDINLGASGAARGVDATASVSIPGGGWLRAFEDTTFKAIAGEGVDGGIALPADKSLTVNGSGATNAFAGRIVGKDFVKAGDSELTYTGVAGWTGETKVQAGTLKVGGGAYRRNRVAYWNFDDPTDMKADSSTVGLLPLALRTTPAPGAMPQLIDDGVSGKAIRFGDFKSIGKTATLLRAETNAVAGAYVLPKSNMPFTFSFWMRPKKGLCGVGSNFILVGNMTNYYTNEYGRVTKGVDWSNNFVFGSAKYDEATGNSASAFKNLCFYCGTGWTRGGVYTDDKKSSPNVNKVAIAAFSDPDYLFDGDWHHIVGTYGGTNRLISIYVDGVLMDQRTRSADFALGSGGGVQIGSHATNGDTTHNFSGDLDEIQWLNGAWTLAEVQTEYNAKKPKTDALLPDPVAHWTFSALKQSGDRYYVEDATGNGFDLEAVTTNADKTVAQQVSVVDVTYPETRGKAIYTGDKAGAHFKLKDGVDMTTKVPVGSGFTFSVRRSKAVRANFIVFGDPADYKKMVALVDDGAPAYAALRAATSGLRKTSVLVRSTCATPAANGYVRPNWLLQTVTYDPVKQLLKMYIDGRLAYVAESLDLKIDPKQIALMWTGNSAAPSYQAAAAFDDMRVYDCVLDAAQIAALAKVVRYGDASTTDAQALAAQPSLPANAEVSVAAGATFRLSPGFTGTIKSVSGAGTLQLSSCGQKISSGALADFTGSVAGAGAVTVDALSLALADAGSATPVLNASVPLTVPAVGTVAISGGSEIYGKRWLIAKGGTYTLPADFSGWTITQPSGAFANAVKFEVKDGDLYLRTRSFGTAILLK